MPVFHGHHSLWLFWSRSCVIWDIFFSKTTNKNIIMTEYLYTFADQMSLIVNIQQRGGIFLIVPLFCLLVCWSTLSSLKLVCLILKDKKWLLLKKRIFTNQLTKKLYCGDLQHPVARVDTHACNWQYKLLINLHPPNPLETFTSFSVWAKDINYTHSHNSYIQWPWQLPYISELTAEHQPKGDDD